MSSTSSSTFGLGSVGVTVQEDGSSGVSPSSISQYDDESCSSRIAAERLLRATSRVPSSSRVTRLDDSSSYAFRCFGDISTARMDRTFGGRCGNTTDFSMRRNRGLRILWNSSRVSGRSPTMSIAPNAFQDSSAYRSMSFERDWKSPGATACMIDQRSPGLFAMGVPVSAQRYSTDGLWNTDQMARVCLARGSLERWASSKIAVRNGISFNSLAWTSQLPFLTAGLPPYLSQSVHLASRMLPYGASREKIRTDSMLMITTARSTSSMVFSASRFCLAEPLITIGVASGSQVRTSFAQCSFTEFGQMTTAGYASVRRSAANTWMVLPDPCSSPSRAWRAVTRNSRPANW